MDCPSEITFENVFKTDDKSRIWRKFPILNGFLRFTMQSDREVSFFLTNSTVISDTDLVLSFGIMNNNMSSIKLISDKYSLVEAITPCIIKKDYFVELLITWTEGEMKVIHKEKVIMNTNYPIYPIYYVAECPENENEILEFIGVKPVKNLENSGYIFYEIQDGQIDFSFRGKSDACIALMATGSLLDPMCEISIGEFKNQITCIRINNIKRPWDTWNTPKIVNEKLFTKFRLNWHDKTFYIYNLSAGDDNLVILGEDCIDFTPKFFAIRTGHGTIGEWIFSPKSMRNI